jgi:hypothetical protein
MRNASRGLLLALGFIVIGCECGSPPAAGDGGPGGGATGGGGSSGDGGGSGGGASSAEDAGCGLVTCASASATCGPIGDGCGSLLDCGRCTLPQTCGGGGVPSQCGGDAGCVAVTCAALGAECGPMADRCGGLLDCGTCGAPETCGGGGIPSRCGLPGTHLSDAGTCLPLTCTDHGATCGQVGDGCGGLTASCGSCAPPQSCGGGGQANTCGAPVCVAQTCGQLNAECGPMGDGCGGLTANCGSCTLPEVCGGGGVGSLCGQSVFFDGGACTNLCLERQACPGVDGGTTLSGKVVAPTQADAGYGQPDPIPGALVYIPNGTVEPLNADGGVSCDLCSDGVTGSPLVSTYTRTDGTFTLTNVPCGAGVQVPVVIQLGKWRRQVTVSAPTCCAPNAMPQEQTRLPRRQAEGHPNDNIPRIAVATGDVDTIECVLLKLGIAPDQYSSGTGNGRVRFYRDNGQVFSTSTPDAGTLFDDPNELRKHDMVILDCVGEQQRKTKQQRLNMEAYANAGGRIFASHYAYVWLYGRASDQNPHTISFTGTASWNVKQDEPPDQDAFIDTSFAKGATFAEWVGLVGAGASASPPQIRINTVRHDLDAVIPPAQRWVYGSPGDGGIPFQYTFNTPVSQPPANQCGRVLFSDFHVVDARNSDGVTWPGQCSVGPMTPQEKVFEYLIFDLSSCIRGDDTPVSTCTPTTCAAHGFNCGSIADGCGSSLNCGTCLSPLSCGGGGTPNVCGSACTPRTCPELGFECGPQSDGCGGVVQCGDCFENGTCGGGGVPGVCGAASCTPLTCAQQSLSCGPAGDGCGQVIQCGDCFEGETCGGAGIPGVCGTPPCVPNTCVNAGATCGELGDGCGGSLNCGTCPDGLTCGGTGIPNVCGGIG